MHNSAKILYFLILIALLTACSSSPTNTPLPTNTPIPTTIPPCTLPHQRGVESAPVKIGEYISLLRYGVINFTICVDNVIRGNDAWVKIHAAEISNMHSPENQEYVLIYLKIRYTQGPQDQALMIGIQDFVTISKDQVMDIPHLVMPTPFINDITLLPNAEVEGWLAGTVYIDDETPLLVFGMRPGVSKGLSFLLTP